MRALVGLAFIVQSSARGQLQFLVMPCRDTSLGSTAVTAFDCSGSSIASASRLGCCCAGKAPCLDPSEALSETAFHRRWRRAFGLGHSREPLEHRQHGSSVVGRWLEPKLLGLASQVVSLSAPWAGQYRSHPRARLGRRLSGRTSSLLPLPVLSLFVDVGCPWVYERPASFLMFTLLDRPLIYL